MQIRKGDAAAINTGLNPDPTLAVHATEGTAPGIRSRDVLSTDVSVLGDTLVAPPQNTSEPDYRDSIEGAAEKFSSSQAKPEHAAALSASIKGQAVKDKILAYHNNPKLQVQELLRWVAEFYCSDSCPASLKSAYADVNAAISTGTIPERRDLFSDTDKPFFRLMGAIGSMHSMRDRACETDMNLDLGGSLDWHNLYIDIYKKLKKDPSGYEGLNRRIRDNHKKLTDESFRRGTPFAYDPIDAILKLKPQAERDLLHKKLFPGVLQEQLPCFSTKKQT